MDSIGRAALALIVLVPAVFLAARIWRDPFVGFLLWVILLPVGKTAATFVGYAPDEGPEILRKLTAGDLVLLFTTVAGFLDGSVSLDRLGTQARRVVMLFSAFCAFGIVSAILGQAGPEAFIELGTYSWLCVTVVVICCLLRDRVHLDRALGAFKWAAVVACIVSSAGAILLILGHSTDNLFVRGGRVTGLFEAANQLEAFMVAVIPFLCAIAFSGTARRGSRFLHGALVAVAAFCVLTTGSRWGIAVASLVIGLMILVASMRAAVIWACVVVLAGGSAWQWYEQHRAETPFAIQRALSVLDQDRFDLGELSHGRADQLQAWHVVFAEHPVFGVGLDQFRGNVSRLVPEAKAQEMHNSYLAVLVEGGLVGALCMFLLLGTALTTSIAFVRAGLGGRRRGDLEFGWALLVSYVSLLVCGMTQYGLRQRFFWFLVAVLVSLPRLYAPSRDARSRVRRVHAVPADELRPVWSAAQRS